VSAFADRVVFRSGDARAGLVLAQATNGAIVERSRVLVGSMDPISGWMSPQYGDLVPTPTVWHSTRPTGTAVTFVNLLYPFESDAPNVVLKVRWGSEPGVFDVVVDEGGRRRSLSLDLTAGVAVRPLE
jgi:hypothetical protein